MCQPKTVTRVVPVETKKTICRFHSRPGVDCLLMAGEYGATYGHDTEFSPNILEFHNVARLNSLSGNPAIKQEIFDVMIRLKTFIRLVPQGVVRVIKNGRSMNRRI